MTDRGTIRIVIGFLGVFALAGLAGVIYLVDQRIEAALVAVVSTPMGVALGALGSMLASTRTDIAPVQVVNAPQEPVPVADVAPEQTVSAPK